MNLASAPATAILVLGMHRSGTSAATRVVNLLGAHLGGELLSAKADNKHGFWENSRAVEIHENLLLRLGRTWHDFRELPQGWLNSIAADIAIAEIMALVSDEMSGSALWAVKDPRMCRLAPLWIKALGQLGIRSTALLVVREPYEVASSLNVRDGWSYPHSYLMWAQHLLDSYKATEELPRALVTYEELITDWKPAMERVASELGVSRSLGGKQAEEEVAAFISPTERHHRAPDNFETASDRRVPEYLQSLYRACEKAGTENVWFHLAQLCYPFERVSRLFFGPIQELTDSKEQALAVASNWEALALERIERIHQQDLHCERLMVERDAAERVAADRLNRIRSLEIEQEQLFVKHTALNQVASERALQLEVLNQVASERALQLEQLKAQVGSRRWLLRRILRLNCMQ